MIVLAILFPPLYFLINKKFGRFLVTFGMFVFSFFCAMTFALIPISFILWFIAAFAASRLYRKNALEAHADMFTTKMVEKLNQPKPPSAVPPVIVK